MNSYISDRARGIKEDLAKFMKENHHKFIEYIEKAEMPQFFLDKIKDLKITGMYTKGYGSPEFTLLETCALYYEMGR